MKRYRIVLGLVIGSIFIGAFSGTTLAQIENITFPIAELGGCTDKEACRLYCEDVVNSSACLDFGQSHGLIKKAEAEKYKSILSTAPGGCRSENECRTYCESEEHLDECISFVEKHELLPKEEIKQIKETAKVARKVLKEDGPGGCKGENECHAYCNDSSHAEECLAFAEKHGFISKEEAQQVKKFIGKPGPGGCKGEECRTYCDDPNHQEECLKFAEENGLMSKEDAERARKFVGKAGPGGCKGEECRTYCENPDHSEECLDFAEQNGLVPKEEVERARKLMKISKESGGPGGCRGIECRDYCDKQENREQCFNFAKEQGLTRPADEENFRVGEKLNQKLKEAGGPGGCKSEEECRTYCSDGSRVEECIAFAASHGGISEERARQMLKDFTERQFEGDASGTPNLDELRRHQMDSEKRFDQFKQFEHQYRGGEGEFPGGGETRGQFPGGGATGGNFPGGPGGCQSQAECMKYCSEHIEECMKFGGGEQGMRPNPNEERREGQNFDPQMQKQMMERERVRQGMDESEGRGPRGTERQPYDDQRPQGGEQQQRGQPPFGCDEACQQKYREQFQNQQQNFQPQDRGSEECSKQGGRWNGSGCIFPQQPQFQGQRPPEEQYQNCDEACQQKYREQFQSQQQRQQQQFQEQQQEHQQQFQGQQQNQQQQFQGQQQEQQQEFQGQQQQQQNHQQQFQQGPSSEECTKYGGTWDGSRCAPPQR